VYRRFQFPQGFREGQTFTTGTRSVTLEGDRTALLTGFEAAALCARGISLVEYFEEPPAIAKTRTQILHEASVAATLGGLEEARRLAAPKLNDLACGGAEPEHKLAGDVAKARAHF
jgi:hypothetical protein